MPVELIAFFKWKLHHLINFPF
jgi:hypothetical protein